MKRIICFLIFISFFLFRVVGNDDPASSLQEFTNNDIRWVKRDNLLAYRRDARFDVDKLRILPKESLELIKNLRITYLNNKIDKIPSLDFPPQY